MGGRSRLLVVAFVVVLGLVVVPGAGAATFTVDSVADDPDAALNGTCATAASECTLRAALQEANRVDDGDVIDFEDKGTTIEIASALPTIVGTTEIYGCEAPTIPAATTFDTAPCTGIRAPNATAKSYTALTIQDGNVIIQGLAITNVDRGIKNLTGLGADRRIWGSWFGLKLDGSAEGNKVGVEQLGTNLTVGGTAGAPGTAMAERNVFAANEIGVRAAGSGTSILGNYFGVKADGLTSAANTAAAIRVTGSAQIGGFLTSAVQGTPECDGPCNVIAGANTALNEGVDLSSTEGDAIGGTIRGNYIGLDSNGVLARAPVTGIDVGAADNITVGGIATGDRNVIAAAGTAIHAGTAASSSSLTVQNNYIGTDRTGGIEAGGSETGIHARSIADNPMTPALEPMTVADNVIAIGTTYGMLLSGESASVTGNSIGVGPSGQNIGGPAGTVGIRIAEGGVGLPADDMLVDNNVIGNTGGWAVSLEGGDDNTFIRNRIGVDGSGNPHPNASRGIAIATFFDQQPTGNVIGSDTASEENILSNNTHFALGVGADVAAGNTIKGNRGQNNGRFIDVGNFGPGNGTAAHEGVEAPVIAAATQDKVVGTGRPQSTIRIFFKTTAAPGEIDSQRAGTGVVQSDGTWTWTPNTTMPAGQIVAVTQTSAAGSTSELSDATTLAASSADVVAPTATITPPASPTNDSTPAFGLSSDETPELFICRVGTTDPYSACSDPYEPSLADGSHTIHVRAVDAAGNVQPEPATTATVTVDTFAPAPPVVSGPTGPINDSTPTYTFTGEGPDFDCQIDTEAAVSCDGNSFTPGSSLEQGPHTFKVTQTDAAGNTGPEATRSFTVDTIAPDTQIDSGPSGPTNDSTPTFGYSVPGEANPGSFQCTIDSAPVPCAGASSGSFTAGSALPEGPHTFTVRATDAATNQDPDTESRSFTVDTIAPAAPAITSAPPPFTNDSTPTFAFTGEASATFSCSVDGGAPVACNGGNFTPSSLGEGSHTFQVTQSDAATNASPAASRSFTVDTIPPDTRVDSAVTAPVTDSTPTFDFSSPGSSGVGFRCRIDSGQFAGCSAAGQHTPAAPLSSGRHVFEVMAVDPAGNADQTPAQRQFTVGACAGRAATIVGTGGRNLLKGTRGADIILALGGNDVVRGLAGNDVACGGGGRDRLIGGGGRDTLIGQGGADRLVGGPGRDKLRGGPGRDSQKQ